MKQEKIWDAIAPKWAEFKTGLFPDVKEFLEYKKGKILDLGCGSGRNFPAIKGEIYGVDFSQEMLSIAKRKFPNAVLKKSLASKVPFQDNFFDAAIYIATLHCIESEEDRADSLKELHRVLKPKAQAFITVWSANHERVKKIGNNFLPWTVDGKKLQRFYYVYTQDELKYLLEKSGFKITSIKENKNIVAVVEKP